MVILQPLNQPSVTENLLTAIKYGLFCLLHILNTMPIMLRKPKKGFSDVRKSHKDTRESVGENNKDRHCKILDVFKLSLAHRVDTKASTKVPAEREFWKSVK